MKSECVLDALGQVNDKYIVEAAPDRKATEKATSLQVGRRLSTAIIAAIIALCLMGAGVAAVIYGDSIQTWFAHQWEAITGQSMSESHTAVIDHLSQEIGASQTIGGVTVTVNSATVGDGTFYLLLWVEGLHFSDKYNYAFDKVNMEIEHDPLEDAGGLGGYGFQYQGVDGTGAALLLMDYNYASMGGYKEDTRPLEVSLTLTDLVRGAHTDKKEVLAEGEWNYSFSLDRSQLPEAVNLPDTEVVMMDHSKREEVSIDIRNIELTNTGIRFQLDHYEGDLVISDINVVLKNGAVVGNNGGVGTPLADGSTMSYSFQWQFPIDLSEASSIQFGSTHISVN